MTTPVWSVRPASSPLPIGQTVESWVTDHYAGLDKKKAVLVHLKIPDDGRAACLCTLNRMNINHKTLFRTSVAPQSTATSPLESRTTTTESRPGSEQLARAPRRQGPLRGLGAPSAPPFGGPVNVGPADRRSAP